MKSETMIAAWRTLDPDPAALRRMRAAVCAAQAKEGEHPMKKERMKAGRAGVAAAACLLLLLGAAGMIGGRMPWLLPANRTVETAQGTLRFSRAEVAAGSLVPGCRTAGRALTAAELAAVFPGQEVTRGYGTFAADTGRLLHLEGEAEGARLLAAAAGMPLTDVIVSGETQVSVLGGVAVTAVCFVTEPNSRGERTAVCTASFQHGGVQMQLERSGPATSVRAVCDALTAQVLAAAESAPPDFDAVTM